MEKEHFFNEDFNERYPNRIVEGQEKDKLVAGQIVEFVFDDVMDDRVPFKINSVEKKKDGYHIQGLAFWNTDAERGAELVYDPDIQNKEDLTYLGRMRYL